MKNIEHKNSSIKKAEMWWDCLAYFQWNEDEGKKLILVWDMHWDERVWWEIINNIFNQLVIGKSVIKNKLLLILANPIAFKKNKKCYQFDNLNWLFWPPWWEWSYEYRRAQEIMKAIHNFWPANLAIDLHQTYRWIYLTITIVEHMQ